MRNSYIVSYDIADPKRLRECLQDYEGVGRSFAAFGF